MIKATKVSLKMPNGRPVHRLARGLSSVPLPSSGSGQALHGMIPRVHTAPDHNEVRIMIDAIPEPGSLHELPVAFKVARTEERVCKEDVVLLVDVAHAHRPVRPVMR